MGTSTSTPSLSSSLPSATPCCESSGTSRYRLSFAMARLGAVEQQLITVMPLGSAYSLTALALALVPGPSMMPIPRWCISSASCRARTGSESGSSATRTILQSTPIPAKNTLKSSAPSRVAARAVPWEPLSIRSSTPTSTSPLGCPGAVSRSCAPRYMVLAVQEPSSTDHTA